MPDTNTGTLETTDTGTTLGEGHKVILYDDSIHTMDEVVAQIIKAIACSRQRAEEIMMEAHSKGRSVVIASHLERCEHVASVLEQIGLRTDIE
jgi:ATP-dependent Clp protease adapter protein ClpS